MENAERITALIVDDEPVARARIRRLLREFPEIEIIGECADGFQAISLAKNLNPDLLFLDIQIPGRNGFNVLEEISKEVMPVTIFVTAFEKYALRAFEVCALDYLLKPFEKERFKQAVERARIQIVRERSPNVSSALFNQFNIFNNQADHIDRLVIKSGGRINFLKVNEIECITALGNYVQIYRQDEKYILNQGLSSLEKQLDNRKFVRIHRSTIVNIEHIREIQSLLYGQYLVILNSDKKIILSRRYYRKVKHLFA